MSRKSAAALHASSLACFTGAACFQIAAGNPTLAVLWGVCAFLQGAVLVYCA